MGEIIGWSVKGKGVQKWDALVNDIGEEYLTNFFVSFFFYTSQKRIAKNKLPDEFNKKYKVAAQNDFDFFFNMLKEAGILYGKLRSMATGVDKLDNILKDFKNLNFDQVYVILFAAAYCYGEDVIKSSEYIAFASTLQTLVVRMQVCEKSMNKLDTLFSTCIDTMKNGGASLPVITNKIKDEYENSIDDGQFENAFENFAPTDNKVAEFYLRHIEDYVRRINNNRSPVDRGLTVEHVIPQLYDLSDWYGDVAVPDEIIDDFKQSIVENIGNKLLLYGDDNSSARNNNYKKKIAVYKDGKRGQNQGTPEATFILVKELLDEYPDRFNHEEVKLRAKQLAGYAKHIWK